MKQIRETLNAFVSLISLVFVGIGFVAGWIILNIHVGYLWAIKTMDKLGGRND